MERIRSHHCRLHMANLLPYMEHRETDSRFGWHNRIKLAWVPLPLVGLCGRRCRWRTANILPYVASSDVWKWYNGLLVRLSISSPLDRARQIQLARVPNTKYDLTRNLESKLFSSSNDA